MEALRGVSLPDLAPLGSQGDDDDIDLASLRDLAPQAGAIPGDGVLSLELGDLIIDDFRRHPTSAREERLARVLRAPATRSQPLSYVEHSIALIDAYHDAAQRRAEAPAPAELPAAPLDTSRVESLRARTVAALDVHGVAAVPEVLETLANLARQSGAAGEPDMSAMASLVMLFNAMDEDMRRRDSTTRRAFYDGVARMDLRVMLSAVPAHAPRATPFDGRDGAIAPASESTIHYAPIRDFAWGVSPTDIAKLRLHHLDGGPGHQPEGAVRALLSARRAGASPTEQLERLQGFFESAYAHHGSDVRYDDHGHRDRADAIVRHAVVDTFGLRRIDCEGYHALARRVLEDPSLAGAFRVRAVQTPNHVATLVTTRGLGGQPHHYLFNNGALTALGEGRLSLARLGDALGWQVQGAMFSISGTQQPGVQPRYVYDARVNPTAARRVDRTDDAALATIIPVFLGEYALYGQSPRANALLAEWPLRREGPPSFP